MAKRQAKGLRDEPRYDLSTVAFNGRPEQAGLLRGFGLFGMQEMLKEKGSSPTVLLDVECTPVVEGDTLHYHVPHQPKQARAAAMKDVYVVDVGALLGEKAP